MHSNTNILYCGEPSALAFAQRAAGASRRREPDWCRSVVGVHRTLATRRLGPRGSAVLLATALLVDAIKARLRP